MTLSIIKFLPFAIFALAFLFGGHYLIYRSIISVFKISHPSFRITLAAIIIVLSVGFFVASIIAHISQSWLTKIFYIVSASWLGVAINLLWAAVIIWLATRLIRLMGLSFNQRLFGSIIFFLAILFSIYGIWAALNPKVKKIDIAIKNLPPQWQGKTIVQLSDVHLGYIHGTGFLRKVVLQTNAQNPDLILITGDLFDGMDGDLNVFIKPLNDLKATSGVFFVTGNHEAYVGLDRALAVLKQTKIRVLTNEAVNLNGLQIVGLDYSLVGDQAGFMGKSNQEAAIINSLKNFDRNKPSILMYHAPANINQAIASGINFQLSGHAHKGQIWPFDFFPWLAYGKYYYGFHALGDFSIYTAGGVGTWGPPLRTTGAPEIPVFKLQ